MALTITFPDNNMGVACPQLVCIACGGRPPYTWKTTAGKITVNSAVQATLTPPVNPGPGVVGEAYAIVAKYRTLFCDCAYIGYKCDGTVNQTCTSVGAGTVWNLATGGNCLCTTCPGDANDAMFNTVSSTHCPNDIHYDGAPCTGLAALHVFVDERSGSMITQGCLPCAVALNNAVVTVTDSTGVSASRTVKGA